MSTSQFVTTVVIGTGAGVILSIAVFWFVVRWMNWYESKTRRPPLPDCFGNLPSDPKASSENGCHRCGESWLCREKIEIFGSKESTPSTAGVKSFQIDSSHQESSSVVRLRSSTIAHPPGALYAMFFPCEGRPSDEVFEECREHALKHCPPDLNFEIQQHDGPRGGAWEWYSVPRTENRGAQARPPCFGNYPADSALEMERGCWHCVDIVRCGQAARDMML